MTLGRIPGKSCLRNEGTVHPRGSHTYQRGGERLTKVLP
jgi:hypothetical protein